MKRSLVKTATIATLVAACNPVQETVDTPAYVCDQFTDHPSVNQIYRGPFEEIPPFMHGFLGLTKRAYEGIEDFVICIEKDVAGNGYRSVYGNAVTGEYGNSKGFLYYDLPVDSILLEHHLLTPLVQSESATRTPYLLHNTD